MLQLRSLAHVCVKCIEIGFGYQQGLLTSIGNALLLPTLLNASLQKGVLPNFRAFLLSEHVPIECTSSHPSSQDLPITLLLTSIRRIYQMTWY